jgi:hypothetical protein
MTLYTSRARVQETCRVSPLQPRFSVVRPHWACDPLGQRVCGEGSGGLRRCAGLGHGPTPAPQVLAGP